VTQPASIPGFRTRLLLGTGQTSIVFLAEDQNGREVALKLPRPEIRNDPVLNKVFYNEVVMLKTLDHPNVVRFLAGVPSGGHAHLAVQYFPEGELNPSKLSLEQIFAILLDVASALEYCHSKKVIHQDVKPSNVYTANGRGFLADFGAASSDKNPTPPAGSPFYMAPEVFRGENGTPKSDVYSFSVMAYELIGKRRPLLGDTVEELQLAHLTKIPTLMKNVNNQVPRDLARLIDRGLAKEVGFRPAMRDFRLALHELVMGDAPASTNTAETVPEPEYPVPVAAEAPKLALGRAPKPESKATKPPNKATAKPEKPQGLLGKLFGKK
jgi:eukaryotic-like serine/threonine-protein kinase